VLLKIFDKIFNARLKNKKKFRKCKKTFQKREKYDKKKR